MNSEAPPMGRYSAGWGIMTTPEAACQRRQEAMRGAYHSCILGVAELDASPFVPLPTLEQLARSGRHRQHLVRLAAIAAIWRPHASSSPI